MTGKDILLKVRELKQSGKKVKSNCFLPFQADLEREWETDQSEESILIREYEGGATRLYFYTTDFEDLKKIVETIPKETVVEIVAKDKEELHQEMESMGFMPLAFMMRVSNRDVSPVLAAGKKDSQRAEGHPAVSKDAQDIYDLLVETFDTRISHLPSMDEVLQAIDRQEFVLVRGEKQKIDSLLQCQVTPRSYYVNQIINRGEKDRFHAMMVHSLSNYCSSGGKYAYAWVDEKNLPSLKFFEKYGMKFDGTWNVVYVSEKKE